MESSVNYLRLSLTDRCNLNCIYCTPLEKSRFLARGEVLTHEETARAARAFVKAGVRKIRLTGGEPLLKKDIIKLAGMLKALPGLEELALTTNGVYLEDMAGKLRAAGLDRVNISIDTLKKEKFKMITGSDEFDSVWRGIEKSLETGFTAVKLNVILMKGINDDEIADFTRLSIDYPLVVRFIEFFPTNKRSIRLTGALIRTEEVKKRIEASFGSLSETVPVKSGGPARGYKLKGAKGELGFISGRSDNFCGACNRVRMDCSGKVYPCLFAGATHDLRPLLRGAADDAALVKYIKGLFLVKSKYNKASASGHIEMSSIGG
ncbi:MAG: GTP 3',8-cyclase MoaA [Elusimicrobia bacterium]|nr:GTP 3',8-cyclase MoaA [Elusimicrobiota bacterium]